MSERRFPPVTQLGAASIGLVAVGVIYLASYLPKRAPLWLAVVLVVVAAAVLLVNLGLISRIRPFAWWRFFGVLRWGLLAYAIVSGMLEYTFLYDHTHGAVLAIMTAELVLFMSNVALMLAWTVARYQAVEASA